MNRCSYTLGRGVEGLMRLTVRLKNPDESFEPAVNLIPIPDAPGAKLDYDYVPVNASFARDVRLDPSLEPVVQWSS